MKLYYIPNACSLSPHVVLREAGVVFDLERYDPSTGTTAGGADYRVINPKAKVPALVLDDGEVLTEGAAIVQYLADRHPEAALAPPAGTLARARVVEQLTFIAAELHKAFSPLFAPGTGEEEKTAARTRVEKALDHVESQLADGRAYLTGEAFSIADAYLFTVARWTGPTGIGLSAWPRLAAFVDRVAERPAVRDALEAEQAA